MASSGGTADSDQGDSSWQSKEPTTASATVPDDGGTKVGENFMSVVVVEPRTHGVGKKRFTDYEVRTRTNVPAFADQTDSSHELFMAAASEQTNLPIFILKESTVRRRYSDFEWLRSELERDSKILVPALPGKALKRLLPFRSDDGIFEDDFIEERRGALEIFVNKVSGHPLAQNEKCLHMFLQDKEVDKNYVPGKVKNT
ncbi:sorting nexin-12-like isoform X1 [Sycon ciliatum]|uniref:sorting nexin-12-like isoform X1 n=1 Tax=Sycon ciliatum TaxID=27933 RepID=UPI0020AC69C2|eukprot:scpid88681/ scgid1873/ Sorting nexin-12